MEEVDGFRLDSDRDGIPLSAQMNEQSGHKVDRGGVDLQRMAPGATRAVKEVMAVVIDHIEADLVGLAWQAEAVASAQPELVPSIDIENTMQSLDFAGTWCAGEHGTLHGTLQRLCGQRDVLPPTIAGTPHDGSALHWSCRAYTRVPERRSDARSRLGGRASGSAGAPALPRPSATRRSQRLFEHDAVVIPVRASILTHKPCSQRRWSMEEGGEERSMLN